MFPECGAKSNSNVGIQLWSFHWKCCICSVVRVVVCYLVAYMICNQETVLNLIIYLWTGSERFWRPHMTSHVISGRGQGRPVCVGEHGVFASIIHTNGRAWKLSLGVGGVSEKKKVGRGSHGPQSSGQIRFSYPQVTSSCRAKVPAGQKWQWQLPGSCREVLQKHWHPSRRKKEGPATSVK